jgi:hypothetical protein
VELQAAVKLTAAGGGGASLTFERQGAHAQHGLHNLFEDFMAIGKVTGASFPRLPGHGAHLQPEVPERGTQRGLGRPHLLHQECPRRQQRPGLLGIKRLDVNPLEPAKADQMGDAARVVAIRFHAHRSEGGSDVVRFHSGNRETFFHQPLVEPLREISGLKPNVFDATALVADCLCDRCRLARRTRFLDDTVSFVDDADMRLVEGNIEANEELHPLDSLIGCNEGHGPNVAVWCKARSAHLYRQAQIFARSGVTLDRSTLAGWGEARSRSDRGAQWTHRRGEREAPDGKAAFHLEPIVDRMAEELKASAKLFMDGPQGTVAELCVNLGDEI